MPIILVVDDSETDRQLVGGLLKPKLDWIVQYAKDGQEGFEMIGQIFPDVVVTDLQMPKLNGIELCRQSKTEHPHVPIILITGKGSEEFAVEALDAGAASYVPKSALAGSLLDTVEQVLSLARHDYSQTRLLKYTTSARHQFNLENDQTLIQNVIDFSGQIMTNLGLGDQSTQRHCAVALEEAMINAIFHGNLEMNGLQVQEARRAMHDGLVSEFYKERCQQSPYCKRRLQVGLKFSRTKIEMVVRDAGPGFDAAGKLENAVELSQLSGAGGRGLTLIRSFMHDVKFNEDGNEIHMALRL
jgi:CheY-like chemotaxis protein/anti-sigma regulatory factor (Ser/Thr protein kinase)